jgi:hypothetical protein
MTKINIEETYNSIKEDISKDYKKFILESKTFLDKYRQNRKADVFLGDIEEPGSGYRYIITIYIRGFRSTESLTSNIHLDANYKQVSENVKRRSTK